MLVYILKRLLQVIPVFIGATLLIYFLVFAMPGDPVAALFGDKQPSPQLLTALRDQYHLNDSFFVQYYYYITGIFKGDLGVTFSGQSVNAVLAQYFLAIKFGWFKTTVGADNGWNGLWLPAIVLGFSLYAVSMRLMRGSVLETLNQDWVRTAYGKGLPRRRVIPVHVLRNSLIPVITNSATSFGTLLVGATVTEAIFNVPGVGNTLFQAIRRHEGPTIVSFVTVFVILYVVVNVLVDLLYGLLDPRIRYA
ncbi:MAG: ABC transporter permease [Nakamurella sp.]